ncbi:hypothetical protein SOCEGT47_079360 [Sorangium cellulosum]|uniref:DUF1835 domain-containing protein n=1 Tax=Sorangium cellulosum TaxID=56 RepID=A0A4P2QD91_SORCE|nr:hypothetical protein [Sorangium cellulosum]AUX27348.1 hypothetical protein SOCEGT47_079360 [Sorangium cellulosum]
MTIHVTTNEDIRRAIQRGLRLPVRLVRDNVLEGPCASDPEDHCERRCDYWNLRGRERTQFRSRFHDVIDALKSRQRIVVWTSGLWSDRLMLWALCAWRLRYRPEHPDLDIVVLGDAPEDGFGYGFVHVKPADARRGLDDARALSRTRVQHMARSWRKVSGRSPVLSTEGGRAGRVRKDLAELGTHQAAFFPRVDGSALTLSWVDELLFACLDKDWSTPVDVFMHRSSAGEELRTGWGMRIGDCFLAMRLRQWAEHRGAEAALESVPYRTDRPPMLEARYRLTAVGDKIKRHGLAEIAQGPPLPVWGVTAYDPRAPWVVMDYGTAHQRIQRLEAPATKDAE